MKKVLGIAVIAGALTFGDYVQPVSSLVDEVKYYHVPIAEHSPKDPWNYSLEQKIVDDHRQLYLYNKRTEEYTRIDQNGCTCGLENTWYDFQDSVKEKWNDAKEWVQDKWEDITD